ncbi:MAG: GtrA family protein [Oscillospiraceae bacterium]|jgi:putative flippase GtrA|nr:GtrA family protein [Oscillospiraceae bacterium]
MTSGKRTGIVRAVKFVLFSISAGALQALSFALLTELAGWPYWPCYLVALILSVLYNFTVNRRFTFRSTANVPLAMLKIALYYCVFTPLSTWLGQVAADARINGYLVLFITMVLNLITEFLFCQFAVYRGTMDTMGAAKQAE